jgi:nucleoside phosphorylase
MIGASRVLESERLMKKYPWQEFLQRASRLENASRPHETSDILYKWETGVPIAASHPVDPSRDAGLLKVHYGTIGAANILLKNPALRDQLARDCGVMAVEMEGSGIADAAWTAGQQYLIVRGICDYCDEKKNDVWQGYAAVATAAYVRALISSISLNAYRNGGESTAS